LEEGPFLGLTDHPWSSSTFAGMIDGLGGSL
jgi:hypothetical protein